MSLVNFPDIVGLVGVSMILVAYYFLNTLRLSAHDLVYQNTNLLGSILILFSLCFHVNLASIVIELAWITISTMGIIRILRKRRRKRLHG